MIKSIEIQNFKSHKHTTLELFPGVNIIVGNTDSGKSAIIQALKWLVFNRPSGDSFRSSWGGDTQVGVVIGTGVGDIYVARAKSEKENEYFIGDIKSEDHSEFKAIKTDVPEEIKRALNLNEINLQTQFESHFLLSKSPGEVAQHFNKVAHLDKIDTGLSNVQRWIREIQSRMSMDDIRMGELVDNLLEYDDLPAIEKKVKKLERIITKRNEKKNQEVVLDRLVNNIELLEEEIKEIKEVIPMGEAVDSLLKIDEKADKIMTEENKLWNLVLNISDLEKTQLKYERALDKLEEQFHKYLGKGKECPLCGSIIK